MEKNRQVCRKTSQHQNNAPITADSVRQFMPNLSSDSDSDNDESQNHRDINENQSEASQRQQKRSPSHDSDDTAMEVQPANPVNETPSSENLVASSSIAVGRPSIKASPTTGRPSIKTSPAAAHSSPKASNRIQNKVIMKKKISRVSEEIRALQGTDKFMMSKASLCRMVKKAIEVNAPLITNDDQPNENYRIRASSLEAIQIVTESCITELFGKMNELAYFANRKTVMVKDLNFAEKYMAD